MYRRTFSQALTHHQVRDLDEASHFAKTIGRPFTATLNINPSKLVAYPDDLCRWLTAFLNKLRIFCERARFGYLAIWVRENYTSPRREHLHILMHVPERDRERLEQAVRRWLPGSHEVLVVGRPEFGTDQFGRRVDKALTYMLKQMTPQAWVALGRQVRREKCCRHTGELVAPVMGKRCGVSRSLNRRTRRQFWQALAARPPKAIGNISEAA